NKKSVKNTIKNESQYQNQETMKKNFKEKKNVDSLKAKIKNILIQYIDEVRKDKKVDSIKAQDLLQSMFRASPKRPPQFEDYEVGNQNVKFVPRPYEDFFGKDSREEKLRDFFSKSIGE